MSNTKAKGRVKVEIGVSFHGRALLSIDFGDRSESRQVSSFKFGEVIGITEKLKDRYAMGYTHFTLSAAQWNRIDPLLPEVPYS